MTNENANNSFDMSDLVIRQRIEAYAAALDANKGAKTDIKDDLLTQFSREVENLQAQLGQIEQAFGKGDAMAHVMREALESAKSRLETRKIELAMEKEEQELEARENIKVVEKAPVFEQRKQEEERNRSMEWLVAMAFATQRPKAYSFAGPGAAL